jgi:hypothetical protein
VGDLRITAYAESTLETAPPGLGVKPQAKPEKLQRS